jgi:predicted nucleic acid-binding protein
MGTQGIEQGLRGDLVLDAGALIALERGSEAVAALAEQVAEIGATAVVPASALAQVWRGGPRSAPLARLIDGCEGDSLDEDRAKEVGERLGARGASDIADAHVVCCALQHRAAVVTSDPADMEALVEAGERLTLVSI